MLNISIPLNVFYIFLGVMYVGITILVFSEKAYTYIRTKLKFKLLKLVWLLGILERTLDLVDQFKSVIQMVLLMILSSVFTGSYISYNYTNKIHDLNVAHSENVNELINTVETELGNGFLAKLRKEKNDSIIALLRESQSENKMVKSASSNETIEQRNTPIQN